MRVLVTGARDYTTPRLIYWALRHLRDATRVDVVIHGAGRGADSIAGRVAVGLGLPVEAYPADWRRYGRGAGPVRNQQMLDEGRPDAVLAFHPNLVVGHGGTGDMVARAQLAGLPVLVIEADADLARIRDFIAQEET